MFFLVCQRIAGRQTERERDRHTTKEKKSFVK